MNVKKEADLENKDDDQEAATAENAEVSEQKNLEDGSTDKMETDEDKVAEVKKETVKKEEDSKKDKKAIKCEIKKAEVSENPVEMVFSDDPEEMCLCR